jgi:hypothetical protein
VIDRVVRPGTVFRRDAGDLQEVSPRAIDDAVYCRVSGGGAIAVSTSNGAGYPRAHLFAREH